MDINNRTHTQGGQAAMGQLPEEGAKILGGSQSTKASLVKAIIADVLIAVLLLNVFALYYFLLPRDLGRGTRLLTALHGNGAQQQAVNGDILQAGTLAQTQASRGEIQNWAQKFEGKFTDGSVEQTANVYRSANISVELEQVQKDGVTYYVADIYLADIQYFKTAFAQGKFGSGIHDTTDAIAKENGAVLAINGDYSGSNAGPVVRNGVLYRDELFEDALVMYDDGSMKAFTAQELDLQSEAEKGVWQVWTFGPMLLDHGQPMETFNSTLGPKNPRTAIGYYEPGHYCFVVVDGRQPGYSDGYTLQEMSQLFAELGCAEAFNLDGGQSSEMAFAGKFVNRPYNGGRGTSDIVYITDK